ncbi:hypothetical protein FQN50_003808 [Emmonsiellopsis sp. PD_5]|nr:hypothetical protein FQN50_003808 [Emmonsiellopsis sp. PD_5]
MCPLYRGTLPHPPNTDRQEVRNSITIQFNGGPEGPIVAHLFNDGTIKTSMEMHAENNRRRAEDARLTAEESKFPELNQTAARMQADAKKMARIQAARVNASWGMINKQLEKDSAEQEYRVFLHEQAQERARATEASAGE